MSDDKIIKGFNKGTGTFIGDTRWEDGDSPPNKVAPDSTESPQPIGTRFTAIGEELTSKGLNRGVGALSAHLDQVKSKVILPVGLPGYLNATIDDSLKITIPFPENIYMNAYNPYLLVYTNTKYIGTVNVERKLSSIFSLQPTNITKNSLTFSTKLSESCPEITVGYGINIVITESDVYNFLITGIEENTDNTTTIYFDIFLNKSNIFWISDTAEGLKLAIDRSIYSGTTNPFILNPITKDAINTVKFYQTYFTPATQELILTNNVTLNSTFSTTAVQLYGTFIGTPATNQINTGINNRIFPLEKFNAQETLTTSEYPIILDSVDGPLKENHSLFKNTDGKPAIIHRVNNSDNIQVIHSAVLNEHNPFIVNIVNNVATFTEGDYTYVNDLGITPGIYVEIYDNDTYQAHGYITDITKTAYNNLTANLQLTSIVSGNSFKLYAAKTTLSDKTIAIENGSITNLYTKTLNTNNITSNNNITITQGELILTYGNISLLGGDISVYGDITADMGNIVTNYGDIQTPNGDISGKTATIMNNIGSVNGDIKALNGKVIANEITVNSNIIAEGNISTENTIEAGNINVDTNIITGGDITVGGSINAAAVAYTAKEFTGYDTLEPGDQIRVIQHIFDKSYNKFYLHILKDFKKCTLEVSSCPILTKYSLVLAQVAYSTSTDTAILPPFTCTPFNIDYIHTQFDLRLEYVLESGNLPQNTDITITCLIINPAIPEQTV